MTSHSSSTSLSTPTSNSANDSLLVTPTTWYRFFTKFTGISGAVSLALALVFFIAYNWLYMGKMAKFGLVEAALILCIGAYCVLVYKGLFKLGQQLLLLIASLITGSLLVLVGQVYQTGADSWQLFFSWALLIIPWVVIARSPALWLLWVGLINLSYSIYVSTFGFLFSASLFFDTTDLIVLGAFNFFSFILWLICQEPSGLKGNLSNKHYAHTEEGYSHIEEGNGINLIPVSQSTRPSLHWSTYVMGLVLTLIMTGVGILDFLQETDPLVNFYRLALWAVFIAFLYWRFRNKRIDVLMLTYLCGSIIIVVMTWAMQYLTTGFDTFSLLILSLLLIGMSGASISWLKAVHQVQSAATHEHITCLDTNTSIDDTQQGSRWYLQLFLAMTGLLSGMLVIFFLALLLENIAESNLVSFIIGSILLTIAAYLFKNPEGKQQAYTASLAFALSIAGQAFLIELIFKTIDSSVLRAVIIILLEVLLIATVSNTAHRLINSMAALVCVVWLLTYFNAPELSAGLLALIVIICGLQRERFLTIIAPKKRAYLSSLFNPLQYASILMLLLISMVFISVNHISMLQELTNTSMYYHYPLAQGVLIAVSLYASHLILKRYQFKLFSRTGLMISSIVILLGIISVYVSGLLCSCLVIVIAVANQKRSLLALGIIGLVGYIFWYYYQLDASLLVKSVSLLVIGLMALLIRWFLVNTYPDGVVSPSLSASSTSLMSTTDTFTKEGRS